MIWCITSVKKMLDIVELKDSKLKEEDEVTLFIAKTLFHKTDQADGIKVKKEIQRINCGILMKWTDLMLTY